MRTGLSLKSTLKMKRLVLFILEKKWWQTLILDQGDYWEKERRVEVLFSFLNYSIKTENRGKQKGGCSVSKREQTGVVLSACPLGSITHISPWLNWMACVQLTDGELSLCVAAATREPKGQPCSERWLSACVAHYTFIPATFWEVMGQTMKHSQHDALDALSIDAWMKY